MKKPDGGNDRIFIDEAVAQFRNCTFPDEECDIFTEPDSFERACARVVTALLDSKVSLSSVVQVVKDSDIKGELPKIKHLLSTIWFFASQVSSMGFYVFYWICLINNLQSR